MSPLPGPLPDLRDEAPRVLSELARRDVEARALGGLAVRLRCPSSHHGSLARTYGDLDLVTVSRARKALGTCLTDLGYEADRQFNALHGGDRMLFWDVRHTRQVDVFVGTLALCHRLELPSPLSRHPHTLEPADLLLTKLQVVEINEKDLKDIAALLSDLSLGAGVDEIDADRIASLLAEDWGWWRTATSNLERVAQFSSDASLPQAATIGARIKALRERVDAAPKTRRWGMRAKLGERKRWYELPEEAGS